MCVCVCVCVCCTGTHAPVDQVLQPYAVSLLCITHVCVCVYAVMRVLSVCICVSARVRFSPTYRVYLCVYVCMTVCVCTQMRP